MITSTANERVKNVIRLGKSEKARREEGSFLAEGVRLGGEVPAGRVREAFLSESLARRPEGEALSEKLKAEIVSDRVMAAMSDTRTPQGVLAVVSRAEADEEEILRTENPLILGLECLQDPGNLGTILRTAEAAGVTGVFLSAGCVDLYNPKVIRSTMGSLFRVPFVTEVDLAAMVGKMRGKGIRIFAAHLAGSVLYDEPDYAAPSAFLIGNEGAGLSESLTSLADSRVRIPMAGQVESLNAAVSCAVLLYEAAGQRRRMKPV